MNAVRSAQGARLVRVVCLVLASTCLVVPTAAWAQTATTGAIAGVVRDTTGAVLPGVTVEAASPALIEKVRVAVTDGNGQYQIINLRPGTYTVTFTLPGFSTLRREGIELTTGFTANVGAELRVGALEETVTVTGASPVVDIQNTRAQVVLSRRELDTLPTFKTTQGFAALTLGATSVGAQHDVGGDKGEGASSWGLHGANAQQTRIVLDGLNFSSFGNGAPGGKMYQVNQLAIEEVSVSTRGVTAEAETGGPQINQVPKEGSNTFHLSIVGNGTGSALQSQKLTDDLIARGLTSAPSMEKVYDIGVGWGGAIREDRLWFYQANRVWGASTQVPGIYYANKSAPEARGGLVYVPDLSRPAKINSPNGSWSGRLTWQATQKQKYSFTADYQRNCNCHFLADRNFTPESTPRIRYRPVAGMAAWNYTLSNRLLLEAATFGMYGNVWDDFSEGAGPGDIPVFDLGTGLSYNAPGTVVSPLGPTAFVVPGTYYNHNLSQRAALSYVTGSHAAKFGFTALQGNTDYRFEHGPRVTYFFRNGRPLALQQWSYPMRANIWARTLGVYAQDQWTVRRLTLNAGVRFDWVNTFGPAVDLAAGPFVPARRFPKARNIPNFTDLSPRLGVAYDVFGNGKTALKVAVGKYVLGQTYGLAGPNLPAYRTAISTTRVWIDANGNYAPDCDLTNLLANGECLQVDNLAFGQTIPVTAYADEVLTGFGNRDYMWQTDATLTHELRPNVALTAGFYRTWYGNFTLADNRAVTSADFDPYCVTAPVDARLGAVSNTQLCGLYDTTPAKFGRFDNLVVPASRFGKVRQVYTGFDVSIRARFGDGGLIQGGVASGSTVDDKCVVVDSPQAARFCKTTLPFEGQTQVKIQAIYPLPYGLQVSGVYQLLPGIPLEATWNAPNAAVVPSLGRNLAAGAGATTPVALIEPTTRFEERLNQMDVRFAKIFRSGGRARLQGIVDVYNLFDSRTTLAQVGVYGPAWRRPLAVQGGRVFKFGGQFDF